MPFMMMGDRPARIPADIVIWGSIGALGLVSGLGAAWLLWNLLHRSPVPGIAAVAVAALTVGFALIGLSIVRPTVRLFVVVASAATLACFFLLPTGFAALSG